LNSGRTNYYLNIRISKGVQALFGYEYQEDVLIERGCVPTFYLKQVLHTVLRELEGVKCIDNRVDVISAPRSTPLQDFSTTLVISKHLRILKPRHCSVRQHSVMQLLRNCR
jgi:hypothetical protein